MFKHKSFRLPPDPGLASVRRATRAALIIPISFTFAKVVIGDSQVITFVAFGCFALLVMADYGGPRAPRAVAYLATTVIGALLVTLGTVASQVVWVAVSVMLLVGFCIQFAGVFGSYAAASQTALLLSFVLAVSIPATPGEVGSRLLGWLLAGMVSTLAGVFLWPRFEKLQLRSTAARASRALGSFIEAQRGAQDLDKLADLQHEARAAVDAVRHQYTVTPKRPAGPTRRDRAFVELLTELERALAFATRPFGLQRQFAHPCLAEGNHLAATVAQTLKASADVLTGGQPPNLLDLEAARIVHRRALDNWAGGELRSGTPAEEVLAGLDVDHELRVISYLAFAIGTNAVITAGGQIGDDLALPPGTPREGRIRPLVRIARTVRTRLRPTSPVLHQSVRVAIGLGVAVLLARLLRLENAFWVVLGTLSVLRSNALGTGRTTLQALLGTVIGFAVGGLFTAVVGASSPALWAALPVAVFLATYASSAIGFVVGQAAFTLLVIILFNLISPVGWRIGLIRIEDVAVGVGISLLTGVLLWPRGARGELGAAVAQLYRGVATYLASSFERVLERGSVENAGEGRRAVERAQDRAGEAFGHFLNERGKKSLEPESAAFLVAAGDNAILVGDLLRIIAESGYQMQDHSPEFMVLRAQTQLMLAGFLQLADRLDGAESALLPGAGVSTDRLREAELSALQNWRGDPDGVQSAMAAVIAGQWLQQLAELSSDLKVPVAGVVAARRTPWWQ